MYFVVIVEPEEVNAERIRAILESVDKNFEYELTPSPEHAIEIVENKKVDVFISSLELSVMTGAELLSMIEMISPDTVRVAMTNPERIVETVACMNQCKTFKVIIKPCRVADDLMAPITASLAYKEMCEKIHQEENAASMGLFSTERDLRSLQISWHEKFLAYQRIQEVLAQMIHTNLKAGGMEPSLEAKLKKWYDWLLDAYIKDIIDSDGEFEGTKKRLTTSYHFPDEGCYFQMKKNFDEPIAPQKMNEMTYMLHILLETYRSCCGTYKLAAMIEASEKAYILRVDCTLPKTDGIYAEPDESVRAAVAKAAEEAIAAFGNKSYMMTREKDVLINVALRR